MKVKNLLVAIITLSLFHLLYPASTNRAVAAVEGDCRQEVRGGVGGFYVEWACSERCPDSIVGNCIACGTTAGVCALQPDGRTFDSCCQGYSAVKKTGPDRCVCETASPPPPSEVFCRVNVTRRTNFLAPATWEYNSSTADCEVYGYKCFTGSLNDMVVYYLNILDTNEKSTPRQSPSAFGCTQTLSTGDSWQCVKACTGGTSPPVTPGTCKLGGPPPSLTRTSDCHGQYACPDLRDGDEHYCLPCSTSTTDFHGYCWRIPNSDETPSDATLDGCCQGYPATAVGGACQCGGSSPPPPGGTITSGKCVLDGIYKKVNCAGKCPSIPTDATGVACVACGDPDTDHGICALQPNGSGEIFDSCCPGSVAQRDGAGCTCQPTKDAVYRLFDLINGVMLPVVIILGIFLIVLKGYKIMTSQGDPTALQEGKEGLTSAIIGLIFVLMAVSILRVIIKALISGDSSPF